MGDENDHATTDGPMGVRCFLLVALSVVFFDTVVAGVLLIDADTLRCGYRA